MSLIHGLDVQALEALAQVDPDGPGPLPLRVCVKMRELDEQLHTVPLATLVQAAHRAIEVQRLRDLANAAMYEQAQELRHAHVGEMARFTVPDDHEVHGTIRSIIFEAGSVKIGVEPYLAPGQISTWAVALDTLVRLGVTS